MTTKEQKILIRAAIFVFLVALIVLLTRYGPEASSVLGLFGETLEKIYTTRRALARFLISLGPYSAVIFMLLQALQVIVSPVPGELTGLVGGYVYGVPFGLLFSILGLALGSWVAFELANIFGKPFVERLVKQEILDKLNFLSTHTGAIVCFLLFLIPGFPKDILCYVLGLTGMKTSTFLVVSTVGRMPGTYLLTIQGASIRSQEYTTAVVVAVISAAILFIGYLYRDQLFQWIKVRAEK